MERKSPLGLCGGASVQSLNKVCCRQRLSSRKQRSLILANCALLVFSIAMQGQEPNCNIDDLPFPNDSFFDAVDAVSSASTPRPEMPLLWSTLSFVGPKPDPENKYEHRP